MGFSLILEKRKRTRMSYLSLTFAAFVLLLLVVYYLVPTKVRGWVLVLGSLYFYGCFDLRYMPFLVFTALTTWLAALALDRFGRRGWILAAAIIVNFAVWFAIKELPWLLGLAGEYMTVPDVSGWNILVPVGLSYFILQAMGYLVDVWKGKIQPEKAFWKYLLFLTWFPAIVQGPISRYDQLMPQLLNGKKYSFDNIRDHLLLVLIGLMKKMVIADRLGIFVNTCFADFETLRGVVLYLAAVGYAIQLYTDFSGCVDICRGVSGLFGVELIHNFNRPYLSRSIKEFWGKWHMSLSSWLKDYVYIPLGGNRKGTGRKYLNLLITFLVSGLWHGAGFNFFLWGAMHAGYQIIGQATEGFRGRVKKLVGVESGSLSERIYQTLITFNLMTLAWILFRAGELTAGFGYIRNMMEEPALWVLFDGSLYSLGLSRNYFGVLMAHLVALAAVELCTKRQADAVSAITRLHVGLRWMVYLALIFDILLFGVYGSGYNMASFMYGGF